MIRGSVSLHHRAGPPGQGQQEGNRLLCVEGKSSSHVCVHAGLNPSAWHADHVLFAHGPLAWDCVSVTVDSLKALANLPYILITISGEIARFSTGANATFPLYVWIRDPGDIRFSWRLEDAARGATLDNEVARDFLTFRQTYTSRTLLKDVRLLTERSELSATETKLVHSAPDDYLSPSVSEVGSDAAARQALVDVMNHAVRELAPDHAQRVAELSGGRDSSLVGLLASLQGCDSYGILFPGLAGAAQQRRRRLVIARNDLVDHAIVGLDVLRSGTRLFTGTIEPRADLYGPLTHAGVLRDGLAGTVVVTGIGGDEAFAENVTVAAAQPADDGGRATLPKTQLPETGLLAAVARFPFFCQLDCWPVNPYLHSEVVDFSSRLPNRLLMGRRLQVETIERLGIPASAMKRSVPENFSDLLRYEFARTCPSPSGPSNDLVSIAASLRQYALALYVNTWGIVVS